MGIPLRLAMVTRAVIHITERVDKSDTSAPKILGRLSQCMRGGPPHVFERVSHWTTVGKTHQPVAAVGRRTKHDVRMTQRLKRVADMIRNHSWNITADQHHRYPARDPGKAPFHPGADVTVALFD